MDTNLLRCSNIFLWSFPFRSRSSHQFGACIFKITKCFAEDSSDTAEAFGCRYRYVIRWTLLASFQPKRTRESRCDNSAEWISSGSPNGSRKKTLTTCRLRLLSENFTSSHLAQRLISATFSKELSRNVASSAHHRHLRYLLAPYSWTVPKSWTAWDLVGKKKVCQKRSFKTPYRNVTFNNFFFSRFPIDYPLITYYWTVPLILDHSYLFGKSTSLKIGDKKVSGF
jgi:hypothetical protein